MTAVIPARFRGRARRDAAAFYLSQLAQGILAGEVAIIGGSRPTALATTDFLVLEIDVHQKKRANYVAVKLRWPRRPLIRVPLRRPAGRPPDPPAPVNDRKESNDG